MIELPTTKVPATSKSPKILLLYGPPKVGKTTALSTLDNCLTIDIENGSDFLEMLKVKVDNVKDLSEVIMKIRQTNPRPYRYIALDTVTRLEEWAEKEATRKYKSSILGKNFEKDYGPNASVLELPNGGGYLWLRNAFLDLIKLVESGAERIIFVGHYRDKLLAGETKKTGTTVSAVDLDLTGKCRQILCSLADAIGYVYRVGGQPELMINFTTSEEVNCGSRCAHLRGKNMKLIWSDIYTD